MSVDEWQSLVFVPMAVFVLVSKAIYFATVFRLSNALDSMRGRLIQRAADRIDARKKRVRMDDPNA